MTPRKISVHQVGAGSPVREGAADVMLAVKRGLLELGFASEMFVDRIDGGWPSPVRPLSDLRPGAQDLLLIHHWAYHDRLDRLAAVRCRKALFYHGITPPRYFPYDSRGYDRSAKAYAQLASLCGICEAGIALAGATAEELRRRGFSRVTAMPFAADWSGLRLLDPAEPDNAESLPACSLVIIGAIAAINRQREAVALIDQLRSIGNLPLRLTVLGSGEPDRRYRAAVADDIARLGLGDRVTVIDAASPNAVAGYCRAAYACLSLGDGEEAVASTRPAMALDLPVVAYAAPGIGDLLGAAVIRIDSRDPEVIRDALQSLQHDHSLRRRVIRRQRKEACADRADLVRRDLQRWLLALGAYETRSLVARLLGWRGGAARAGGPAPSVANSTAPLVAIHYEIEAASPACREVGDADPQIALALDRLPDRTASLKLTADDAASSPVVVGPEFGHLMQPAAAQAAVQAERIVTIRRSCPARPTGMLGDVRLIHLSEVESRIEPPLAGLINLHLDGVLVPSQSARGAVRDSGVHLPVAAIATRLPWRNVAETIDNFVVSFDNRPTMNRKIRLAWISTYNTRCGLATHSEHLLEHFDRDVYDVTVIGNRQEPLRPDPDNLVRLWPDRSGSLASVREFIRDFDVVFVNFHFSLMEIHDLAETLKTAQQAGIDTHLTVHKTVDTVIHGRVVSLREIAGVLRQCTRVIIHTEADIARLKDFGVIDNVVMIPPGVIDRPALSPSTVRSLLNLRQFHPIVGTFGFLLPPKGLQELIQAFALVLRQFPNALLLMLNAEHPGAIESAEERDRCLALIRDLELEDRVQLVDAFLETDEILLLLNACDLTVFTYQDSAESDSGAVRLGLAAGRPVATTPLPVFANLAGVVHQFSGNAVADIAAGIVALLQDTDRAAAILQRQQEWINRNSWAAQAARIGNIMRGCFEEGHGLELHPPAPAQGGPALPATEPPAGPAAGPAAGPPAELSGEPSGAGTLREMLELLQPDDRAAPLPTAKPPDGVAGWPARQAR